ncbi:MAG TPA: tetratricopeptide repeat protein [Candidatus Paceibacterota bacterium]
MEESYYYDESVVEEVVEEPTPVGSFLGSLGRWLLVGFIFLFPFIFFPVTPVPVDMNKGYLAAIVAFMSLIAWFGSALQEGRLQFVRSWVLVAYGAFLLAWIVSAVFSHNLILSFAGTGSESTTVMTMLVGGIFLFIIPALFSDRVWVKRALVALMASFLVLALFFIVQSIFNSRIFSYQFTKERFFNPLGSWNALGAFFAVIAAIILPFSGIGRSWRKRAVYGLFLLALVLLTVTNFVYGMIGLGLAALLFVALLLSRRMTNTAFFGISLTVLMVVTLLILMRGLLQDELASRFGAPSEVSPAWGTTLNIMQESIGASPVLGSGPNTFGQLWERYKDSTVNNTPFWLVRFDYGVALVPTIVAEGGILAAFLFIVFMIFFIALAFRGIAGDQDNDQIGSTYIQSLVAGSFVLFFFWWVHPLNIALVILTFVLIGLLLAAMSEMGLVKRGELNLFSSTERGFVGSLVIILLLVGSVAGIYFEVTRYFAEVVFARGIQEFNDGKGINASRIIVSRAARYDSRQDQYWRMLAQFELANMRRALDAAGSLQREEFDARFRPALASAIQYGKRAIDINPNEVGNWNVLAQVYEAAILPVAGSENLAVENYEKARELSPQNPVILLSLAQTYLAAAQATILRAGGKDSGTVAKDAQEKAIELLTRATDLKTDYAEAHFLLAQIYNQQGRADEAIARAEQTYQLAPNDAGVLFQLGLLYYQKGDLDRARVAFEKVVEANPDHSNALYFLGLVYDRQGKKEDALKVFQKVASLNPDVKELDIIIGNLTQGEPALEGIVPPPEKRSEVPVKEGD